MHDSLSPLFAPIFKEDAVMYVSQIKGLFEQHLSRLQEKFGCNSELATISILNGDFHKGGNIPLKFTFKNNVSIVCKPRPAVAVLELFDLLMSLLPDFSYLRDFLCIDVGRTTWEQFLMPDTDECQKNSYLLGALACIFFVLRGVDLHADNIIFTTSGPVIIDAETFFHQEYFGCDTKQYMGSLYETALPPFGNYTIKQNAILKVDKKSYIDGLFLAFNTIIKRKKWLRDAILSMPEMKNRYLVRSSQIYYIMLRYLFSSTSMSIFNYRLTCYRDYLFQLTNSIAIAEAEINSLKNGDIPYFTTQLYDNYLYDPSEAIVYTFHRISIQLVLGRLEMLSERWFSQQLEYLEKVQ